VDLPSEHLGQRRLDLEGADHLLQLAQHERRPVQRLPAGLDSCVGVAGRRDEDAAGLAAIENAHLVLGHVARPEPLIPPFHLNQVQVSVDLDHAVYLLDDSLRLVTLIECA
jgi:hypothetical protein